MSIKILANSVTADAEIVKYLDFFEEIDMIETTETLGFIENKNLSSDNEINKIIEDNIPQVESIK